MHVLTNAEKLIPLRDAASLAESRRLAGMRMVTGTTSPSTRYERISVSPASCSIKSEYVIASHAFKPQYKCINYIPAWEQRKFSNLTDRVSMQSSDPDLPQVEYEDIVSGEGTLNKDLRDKEGGKTGIKFYAGDVLYGKLRPYLMNWLYPQFNGVAVGDFWVLRATECDSSFLYRLVQTDGFQRLANVSSGSKMPRADWNLISQSFFAVPADYAEQRVIAKSLAELDNLITLHQHKRESRIIRVRSFIWLAGDISGIGVSAYQPEREDRMTEGNTNAETLFCDYYEQWISVYKEGAIREVTMKKYRLTQAWLGRLIPDLKLADMDRVNYQKLINGYAEHHERQTTMDFHHQLKGAILDAVDEGLIQRDPTRKAIIKGKPPCSKKTKYLNQFELHAVLADLELGKGPSWDWLILLVAKTGLRFSEALGLTPDDFDFVHQTLSVSKTWDYKNGGGFVPTKNASSVRKVQLDWQLIMQLSTLLKDLPAGDPIFVNGKVYNSTANNILARHCERANVPVISIHGLRHTHASLLLFAGVSIASVSKRLGHASMNTTQDTYLHVIRELENKDVDIVMRALSTLI